MAGEKTYMKLQESVTIMIIIMRASAPSTTRNYQEYKRNLWEDLKATHGKNVLGVLPSGSESGL